MVKKNASTSWEKNTSSKLSFWGAFKTCRKTRTVRWPQAQEVSHAFPHLATAKRHAQCQETTAVRWQNFIPSSSERHQVGEKTCTGRMQNHLAKDPAATKMSDTKTENHLKHREITDLANHLKRHPAKIWDKWKSEDIAKQPSQDI